MNDVRLAGSFGSGRPVISREAADKQNLIEKGQDNSQAHYASCVQADAFSYRIHVNTS